MAGIIFDWYIRNVEDTDEGTAFLVVSTPNPATRYTATRNGTAWRCTCTNAALEYPKGVWEVNSPNVACEHIQRAYLYYRNMVGRAAEMKEKVKAIAKETKRINEITEQMAEGTAAPFSGKRNIRLED